MSVKSWEETVGYPRVEVRHLEGALGEAQFFPVNRENEMAVGYVLIKYPESAKWSFDDAVKHWTEFYATTSNAKPEWKPGSVYLRNYFGVLFGPLDASAEDVDACVAEALEMFEMPVLDERVLA